MASKGAWRWGQREIVYLSLHGHHLNDSCERDSKKVSERDVFADSGETATRLTGARAVRAFLVLRHGAVIKSIF